MLLYTPLLTGDEDTDRNLVALAAAINSIAGAGLVTNAVILTVTITAAKTVYHNLGQQLTSWEIVGGTGVGGLHESAAQPADNLNSISLTPDAGGGVFKIRFS